jgi:hypothetical protein
MDGWMDGPCHGRGRTDEWWVVEFGIWNCVKEGPERKADSRYPRAPLTGRAGFFVPLALQASSCALVPIGCQREGGWH